MYAYILAAPQFHLPFAYAEFQAYTGTEAEGRIGLANVAADIGAAAFISTCIRVEASGETCEAMCRSAREKGLSYEGFRIERFEPDPKLRSGDMDTIIAAANAIEGRPDLENPKVRIGLLATPGYWAMGGIVSTYRRDWPGHEDRPNFFSGSLPTRFARGMINLVAVPGDTLIDPCCGVGVSVIEALLVGVDAVGCDLNPRIIKQAAENLDALDLPRRLCVADARSLSGHFDAAVIDLPYGRNVPTSGGLYGDLLSAVRQIADRAAIVAAKDLSEPLEEEFGFTLIQYVAVPKNNMVRHLHVVASDR